jgi:hypothetical protein
MFNPNCPTMSPRMAGVARDLDRISREVAAFDATATGPQLGSDPAFIVAATVGAVSAIPNILQSRRVTLADAAVLAMWARVHEAMKREGVDSISLT